MSVALEDFGHNGTHNVGGQTDAVFTAAPIVQFILGVIPE